MNLINNPIVNYQFVTIQANDFAQRQYFPDLPNLRNVRTWGIVAYSSRTIPQDINNINVISEPNAQNCFVTLVTGNNEFIQKLDLTAFFVIAGNLKNNNTNGTFSIDGVTIDFSKSYIEFPSGAGAYSGTYPYSVPFGIYYTK
jgi:hypothetical protein